MSLGYPLNGYRTLSDQQSRLESFLIKYFLFPSGKEYRNVHTEDIEIMSVSTLFERKCAVYSFSIELLHLLKCWNALRYCPFFVTDEMFIYDIF
jgi:hypothetical protein